jgi:hypothetical protein
MACAMDRGFAGSGLGASTLAGVLAFTVLVFLLWSGPIWSAQTGASHLGRIVVSYLAAVPVLFTALALRHRLTIVRLVTAVGIVWGAKLVLSASVYPYLTSGAASRYEPARPWESRQEAPAIPSAEGIAPVTDGVTLEIAHHRYDSAVRRVRSGASIDVVNRDDDLHVVRVATESATIANTPLPPRARIALDALPIGVYSLSCPNHAEERAQLVVEEAP